MIEVMLNLYDRTAGDMSAAGERTAGRTVYAALRKCGQKEFYSAQQYGAKPDFVAEVWPDEYRGEGYATINKDTREYGIYRVFDRESTGKLELYLTRKLGGINNGNS